MARNILPLTHYEAHMVRMPARKDGTGVVKAVRVVVFGPNFPQRAIEPELLVGAETAQQTSIAHDQRSIQGFFSKVPADGEVICVRYRDSQEGELRDRFSRAKIRPLPNDCEG